MWCFHDRLREFTFSSGAHIKMCPDCTAFDTKRIETLRVGRVEMVKAKEEWHWNLLLEQAGLDVVNDGLDWFTTYAGDVNGVAKMQKEQSTYLTTANIFGMLETLRIQRDKSKTRIRTAIDDHEWVQRQRDFPHSRSMPRHFNSYCVHCIDEVVDKNDRPVRTTVGVYLPIDHECASVRVYNLSGVLIEVNAI